MKSKYNTNFRDMGSFLIQIGLYLTTKENDTFEKTEIHQNILDFLLQSYLYLNSFNLVSLQNTKVETKETDTKESAYLSKKQVIELYHPMLTNYALTEAINKNEIPFYKRGSKYFFKENEIKTWLSERQKNNSITIRKKYV